METVVSASAQVKPNLQIPKKEKGKEGRVLQMRDGQLHCESNQRTWHGLSFENDSSEDFAM
jgi:hypothetical protein